MPRIPLTTSEGCSHDHRGTDGRLTEDGSAVFMESNKVMLDHNQELTEMCKTQDEVIKALRVLIQDITALEGDVVFNNFGQCILLTKPKLISVPDERLLSLSTSDDTNTTTQAHPSHSSRNVCHDCQMS